jgi:hypothetical protein
MPTDHATHLEEQYELFMKQRASQKKGKQSTQTRPPEEEEEPPVIPKAQGFSPKAYNMKRQEYNSSIPLTEQVRLNYSSKSLLYHLFILVR